MNSHIRLATFDDLEAIMEIYNHAILHTTAVYTYEPTHIEERRQWLAQKQREGYPVFVYESEGEVLGFATYGPFRNWPAYQYTIEHSIYVSPSARRQGVASQLLSIVIEDAKVSGYQTIVAGIDASNEGSIKLHEKMDFKHMGTLEKVGYKFERWLNLAFYQKQLKS
ncbi:N-acetyltransferase [Staphylococcus intermedius]|uniref:GNAT family N-acetyltransferase n=1 Tax=Staphylococcus intermedius TaxID=1285 RepID=UPI000BBCCEDE|nr:GNAT family N-acetyltransferase [Staphylococcus intermedius]PCF65427.1 N-acetyltransferase [Staphylococcus intermedius]PCF81105.1 N-acetyltransferase [Staphylococcus intermedius]PCF82387.1 N-acetyltransferase [Staphylococcus intermedius]PCF87088.1 N-acetyltransferase [Staphylococcus intermedius]PCF87646.1 N-acetyltransferase [Staphylococcus intermedius]